MAENACISLHIDGIGSEAFGVGRWQGMAVFVPGAFPGEDVKVRLCQVKKNYARATLLEVLTPSPNRIGPDCIHTAACGGCAFRHVTYDAELRMKQQMVAQSLHRVGGIEMEVPLPLASSSPNCYRNRANLHVERTDGLRVGFYNSGTHRLCELNRCLLLRPALQDLLSLLQEELPRYAEGLSSLRDLSIRCNGKEDQLQLTFVTGRPLPEVKRIAESLRLREPRLTSIWECSGPAVYGVYGKRWRHIDGLPYLEEELGSLRLQLSPASFLQVNLEQTLRLYDTVRDFAGLTGEESLLDLFSGVGSIALFLAAFAREVRAVESNEAAVSDAIRNARLNKIENCRFLCGAAEDVLPRLVANGLEVDVAVLDPPRAGCERRLLDAVVGAKPRRIVYVSCDAATLARDLRYLQELGYFLQRIQPVDMFSRTRHVETVCLLLRK